MSHEITEAFEKWHNEFYGPQDRFNPIRSLERHDQGTGLGYVDPVVQAQICAFEGALKLRAVLAQEAGPAVERQEQDGYKYRLKGKDRAWTYAKHKPEFEHEFDIRPLYAAPPAPVAVVIDERAEFDAWAVKHGRVIGYNGWRNDFKVWQARACLDKVKEPNQ